MTEENKLILLKAADMILKLNQRSLDIIRERKMYHAKLIERSSKCTKDPNPLATTMILLNQKYPLAISQKESRKYGVPRAMIAQNNNISQVSDSHRHGKVLARLDVINWWIEHSPEPNEKLRRLADVLFASLDEQVKQYYQAKWEKARVKWGPPMLQRTLVRTHKPLVDIPHNLRTEAIKEIFFPDYTIPNPSLPSGLVQELKGKINVTLEDNLPLTKQIRIMLNSLDPRERYLPILSSSNENSVQMKHAIVHNNLVIIGYHLEDIREDRRWVEPFRNLLANIIVEGKTSGIPTDELREICLSSTISSISFETMLDSITPSESLEFLWARALFEKPTTLEHKRGPMIICPDPREGREVVIFNKRSISRTIRMGNQVVNFQYNDMRGKYVHNGQTLIEIVSTFSTIRDLISLLKEIAKNINYRYQDTTEIRDQYNDRMIERFIDRAPHKFLDCTITEFSRIGELESGENCGKFRHQPNSEYVTTGCYQLALDSSLNILLPGTALKITVDIGRSKLKPFADDVICRHHRMMRCFNIKETVKEMYYYYLRNVNTLIEKITNKDYIWKNYHMNKFLGASARSMSLMARSIIERLMSSSFTNYHFVCFLYCFANSDPRNAPEGPLTYCLPDGTIVDMGAEKGIFRYSDEHESYMLYGMKVAKTLRKITKEELLSGVLEGYRIVYPAIEGKRLVSVRHLETQAPNIEEGEQLNVFIGGVLYTAVKDSSISYSTKSTMSRHLDDIVRRVEKQGKNVVLGKRWLECEEFDTEHLSPEKKKRKEKEEAIVIEYSDDVVVGGLDQEELETGELFDSDNDI